MEALGFNVSMNYWAVLVAAVVQFIVGGLWYSEFMFGKIWMEGIGKTKEQVQADHSPKKLIWAFIGSFFMAYGLARVGLWLGIGTCMAGMKFALLAVICFLVMPMSIGYYMEGKPCKLFYVDALYYIVTFILMGAIVATWH